MAKLSTEERKKLPKGEFGDPKERKFPMPDKSHARNAKARASQAVNAGRMSKVEESNIDKKADRVMGKKKNVVNHSPREAHTMKTCGGLTGIPSKHSGRL